MTKEKNCPRVVRIEDTAGICKANNTELINDKTKLRANVKNTTFTKRFNSDGSISGAFRIEFHDRNIFDTTKKMENSTHIIDRIETYAELI